MNMRELRRPEQRVGTFPNGALPPPELPTLENLLSRALIGNDVEALDAVVRSLRREMLGEATRYVGSRDAAEDVVQDTWLAALAAIDRFEGRSSLRTWLFRILTYQALNTVRRSRNFIPLSQLAPSASIREGAFAASRSLFVAQTLDPEQALLGHDLRQRLERALLALPERQSEVLRLRDLEGWSTEEVCDRLSLTPGNQRVLLHRARSQLRLAVAH